MIQGYITTKQAKQQHGYSLRYWQKLAKDGAVEARKINRDWLIKADDCQRFARRKK